MDRTESLTAILERHLIQGLVLELAHAETESEQQRHKDALIDLIGHVDPSLDPTLLDAWAQTYLKRSGLYVWSARSASVSRREVNRRRRPDLVDMHVDAVQERK